jgi:predicted double-glycine peptidase
MVLAYYGVERSEMQLGRLSGCTLEKGTGAEGLLKAAKTCGFSGYKKDLSTLADLRRLVLKERIPVIVDWFSTDEGHYSVVVGIDDECIYMQDPELGTLRVMRLDTFMRVWFDFKGGFAKKSGDFVLRRMIVISQKGQKK